MNWQQQARKSEELLKRFINRRSAELWEEWKDNNWSNVILEIHNRDQFYRIVHHLNKTYGQGSKFWTSRGRILRFIDPVRPSYNPPRIVTLSVKQPNIDLDYLKNL